MTASPPTPDLTPAQQHRSEMRYYVWLPMVATVLVVLEAVVTVLWLPEGAQRALMADWLAIWLLLLPMLLCLLPVCIVMVIAILMLNRVHVASQDPRQKVNAWLARAHQRVQGAADRVEQTTTQVGERFTFAQRWLSVFDMPDEDNQS